MKQKHMLKYIISFCLFCITFNVVGQETEIAKESDKPEEVQHNEVIAKTENILDSVNVRYKKKYGLRAGVDIFKPILSIVNSNFSGFDIVGDYRLKRNLYIAAEIGIAEQGVRRDTYHFTTKGSYISAGLNYNMFKNWLEMDNEIYLGVRYGFSAFSQTVDYYTLFQKGTEIDGISDSYFEPKKVEESVEYDDLTAHWTAFVFGMKVEVLKNFYLGVSTQFNIMLASTDLSNFENQYVPGFNKVFSTGTGIGFNYTVSYRIPLYKK